jgi:hypothetical protein
MAAIPLAVLLNSRRYATRVHCWTGKDDQLLLANFEGSTNQILNTCSTRALQTDKKCALLIVDVATPTAV